MAYDPCDHSVCVRSEPEYGTIWVDADRVSTDSSHQGRGVMPGDLIRASVKVDIVRPTDVVALTVQYRVMQRTRWTVTVHTSAGNGRSRTETHYISGKCVMFASEDQAIIGPGSSTPSMHLAAGQHKFAPLAFEIPDNMPPTYWTKHYGDFASTPGFKLSHEIGVKLQTKKLTLFPNLKGKANLIVHRPLKDQAPQDAPNNQPWIKKSYMDLAVGPSHIPPPLFRPAALVGGQESHDVTLTKSSTFACLSCCSCAQVGELRLTLSVSHARDHETDPLRGVMDAKLVIENHTKDATLLQAKLALLYTERFHGGDRTISGDPLGHASGKDVEKGDRKDHGSAFAFDCPKTMAPLEDDEYRRQFVDGFRVPPGQTAAVRFQIPIGPLAGRDVMQTKLYSSRFVVAVRCSDLAVVPAKYGIFGKEALLLDPFKD
ncbi:unnamed protein product [Pedinophyceae sp. YPF-701]|nr:unnamed protein product [Pedinophyceae sp. YPF-701]